MERRVQSIQPPQARRIAVAIVGFTVLILGIAMLLLPGPALVVIPAGLAILALEFAWAKQWLEKLKELAQQAKEKVTSNGAFSSSNTTRSSSTSGHSSPSRDTGSSQRIPN